MPEIRTLLPTDADALQRFLERCFGHGWNWFRRHQPDLYVDDPRTLAWGLVATEGGRIVSHVGTYPMEIVSGPARILCGGIGNVATAPEARGQGHMSQLLERSIARMEEQGWPLSVLWGDTQRYGHFGYARAGLELRIEVNRRSLAGVEPSPVEEVDPAAPDTAERVHALYSTLPYRVERPFFARRLMRPDVRIFLGPDGYVATCGERGGNPTITEIASLAGREPELILGVLERTHGSSAQVVVEGVPGERTERLFAVASMWHVYPQGMFRIIDWPGFLAAAAPVLAERAQGLPPFAVSIGARWGDRCQTATVEWDGEVLHTQAGGRAGNYVEVELRRLTRMVLGAPGASVAELGLFGRLLPVPVHIPWLDHV